MIPYILSILSFQSLPRLHLSVPVSNADSERGFSCMNQVKTDFRNHLTVSSWDTLLRISIEGPSLTSPELSQSSPLKGQQVTSLHFFGAQSDPTKSAKSLKYRKHKKGLMSTEAKYEVGDHLKPGTCSKAVVDVNLMWHLYTLVLQQTKQTATSF